MRSSTMVTWLRFPCTVSLKPFGLPVGTLMLRNVRGASPSRSTSAATVAAAVAACRKSYCPFVRASDTAIPGTPSSAASIAPDTVPEYVTSSPMLRPLLIPDTTRSGGVSKSLVNATLTQSVGVPSTS